MSLLSRWFGHRPALSAEDALRLESWQALDAADTHADLNHSRFVVADVETTGLNLGQDHLIAIGAVAVTAGQIDFGDSFEIVLRQETASDKGNIMIHGITGTAQTEGVAPAEALLRFLEFLGKDPLVAFHVTFDETMIKRALQRYLGLDLRHAWLDLAYVMPGFIPELANRYRSLDDWTGHFGICNYARHSALADALSTAQLFLVAKHLAEQKHITHFRGLQDVEKAQRWISWAS